MRQRDFTYLGTADPDLVDQVAAAARTLEVERVLSVSGDARSLTVLVRFHPKVGESQRCGALREAAGLAMLRSRTISEWTEYVTVMDEDNNRAIAERRR